MRPAAAVRLQTDAAQVPDHDDVDHGEHHESRDGHGQRPVTDEFLAQLLDVDVEHHDHEQEQHHDGADIDEHQDDPQKLRVQQSSR